MHDLVIRNGKIVDGTGAIAAAARASRSKPPSSARPPTRPSYTPCTIAVRSSRA